MTGGIRSLDHHRRRRRRGRRRRPVRRAAVPSAGCPAVAPESSCAAPGPVVMLVTTSAFAGTSVSFSTSVNVPSRDAEAQPHRLQLLVLVLPRGAAALDAPAAVRTASRWSWRRTTSSATLAGRRRALAGCRLPPPRLRRPGRRPGAFAALTLPRPPPPSRLPPNPPAIRRRRPAAGLHPLLEGRRAPPASSAPSALPSACGVPRASCSGRTRHGHRGRRIRPPRAARRHRLRRLSSRGPATLTAVGVLPALPGRPGLQRWPAAAAAAAACGGAGQPPLAAWRRRRRRTAAGAAGVAAGRAAWPLPPRCPSPRPRPPRPALELGWNGLIQHLEHLGRRPEPGRGVRDAQHVVPARDLDVDVGRHARLQLQLRDWARR